MINFFKVMYKFIAVSIFCGTVLISSVTYAQESNVVSINPLGILMGIQNVEFEKVINKNSTISLYYADSGFTPAEMFDVGFQGTEERVTYRNYLSGNAPTGGWVGGSFAYSSGDTYKLSSNGSVEAYINNLSIIALSVESGYRWTWKNGFNVAPIAMYRFLLTDNLLGTKVESLKDVKTPVGGVGLGVAIGYAW